MHNDNDDDQWIEIAESATDIKIKPQQPVSLEAHRDIKTSPAKQAKPKPPKK